MNTAVSKFNNNNEHRCTQMHTDAHRWIIGVPSLKPLATH